MHGGQVMTKGKKGDRESSRELEGRLRGGVWEGEEGGEGRNLFS